MPDLCSNSSLESHFVLPRSRVLRHRFPIPRFRDLPKQRSSSGFGSRLACPHSILLGQHPFLTTAFEHCFANDSAHVVSLDLNPPLDCLGLKFFDHVTNYVVWPAAILRVHRAVCDRMSHVLIRDLAALDPRGATGHRVPSKHSPRRAATTRAKLNTSGR